MMKAKVRIAVIFGGLLFVTILLAMFIHQVAGRPVSTCATVALGVIVGRVMYWLISD